MKKLLVLMLVLGLASLANATITYRYTSDSSGTTTITSVNINTTFYLVMNGKVSDFKALEKIYDPDGQGGHADFTGVIGRFGNGQVPWKPAAGNLSFMSYFGGLDGWELTADQLNPAAGEEAIDGDWFIIEVKSTNNVGTFSPNLYSSTSYSVIGSVGGILVPEPTTLLLLGLGGLFLRRRK